MAPATGSIPPSIPSTEAAFVQPKPFKVELERDKEYWYCSCGRSKNQPWCDGSHNGTAFTPKRVKVAESGTYWMCGCKLSRDAAGFCDGTHNKEEGIKKYNQFLLRSNSELRNKIAEMKSKQSSMKMVMCGALAVSVAVIVGVAIKLRK